MRKLLVMLSIISFNLILAQPGGGSRQGDSFQGGGFNNRQSEKPEMRKFNASEVAGIFNYDDAEVLKKLKLNKNDKADIKLNVRKAIINYNNKINEIALLNKDNFDTLNVYVNTIMKSLRSNNRNGNIGRMGMEEGSNETMPNIKELVEQKLRPVRNDVRTAERVLNEKLESFLSEKNYKNWLKYQKKVKDDLKPKQVSERNNSSMSGRSGGQGGGPPRGGMR